MGDDNGYQAAATAVTSGIIVGTGDTAWDEDQYALAAAIANGTGSGQLSYGACTVGAPSYNSGTKTWSVTVTRNFTNNNAATLTAKEVCLVFATPISDSHFFIKAYNGAIYYMMDRSLFSPTKDVANLQTLSVTYTISMDFSAID